ncbi:hypothetical protein DFH08DRAFT_973335 [Mycena albidolilacea]|uniref:F-box domain-containing protein n=1 Tax=Mycena albidolilacea TaxID=1033008 RepID=A0AAD6Z9M0_9AGAR|nr:hypothetical protein DFH08DRAFT_973335 [Mycena albidolilacea]
MNGSTTSYLDTVATEIWARCWFYSSPTDLRRLALVCRYFTELCQTLLFQRQRFRAQDSTEISREFWLDSARKIHHSAIRLRKLGESIHVSSVRSWSFDGEDGYASLVNTHPNVLNIKSVEKTYLKLIRVFADTLGTHLVKVRQSDYTRFRISADQYRDRGYGSIGQGYPSQFRPDYTTRAGSTTRNVSEPTYDAPGDSSRLVQFGRSRSSELVNHGGDSRPSMRSSSLNLPSATDTYDQRFPGSQPAVAHANGGYSAELIARMDAISLRQDQLQASNNFLLQDNRELRARLAEKDAITPPSHSGDMAARGRILQRKRQETRRCARGLPEVAEASEIDNDAGENSPGDTDSDASNPAASAPKQKFDLATPAKDLPTAALQRAKRALQDEVSLAFRDVVGVPGKIWPKDLTVQQLNETTSAPYLNPIFQLNVTHSDNQCLLDVVVKLVAQCLKNVKNHPEALTVSEVTWNNKTLLEMAKTSFPSCKQQWRQQVDEVAARRRQESLNVGRRCERRVTKALQRANGVPSFVAKYSLTTEAVKQILHKQHMSDEESGPEDSDETSKAVWRTKMIYEAGYEGNSDDVLAKIEFVEVVSTLWRSEEMSQPPLHELSEMAFKLLPIHDKKKIHYVCVRTGRVSARIPDDAPYNFGINQLWLDANKNHPDRVHLLSDWGTYEDPEGFGTNKRRTEENVLKPVRGNLDVEE